MGWEAPWHWVILGIIVIALPVLALPSLAALSAVVAPLLSGVEDRIHRRRDGPRGRCVILSHQPARGGREGPPRRWRC